MKLILKLNLAFLLVYAYLPAQSYHFRNYKEYGFTDNQVFSIHQDAHGFLWFGSGVGLTRYDSESFSNFNVEDSLPANEVLALASDSSTLWAGTGLGLSAFDISDVRQPRYLFSPAELFNFSISCLTYFNKQLWIGTRRNGLYVYQPGGPLYTIKKISDVPVKDMQVFNSHLAVLNNQGLSYYSENGLETKQIIIKNQRLKCLTVTDDSVLFIGTGQGLLSTPFLSDRIGRVFAGKLDNYDFNYMICNNGNIWAAVNEGLLRINHDFFEVIDKNRGLPGIDLRALLFDEEGNLWLGSYTAGLYKLSNTSLVNFDERDGLLSNVVNCIFNESPSQKLVGTDLGIFKIDNLSLSRDKRFTRLNNEIIWFIYKDHYGDLWIGGENLLYVFSGGQLKKLRIDLIPVECTYLDMVQDNEGSYWLCTTVGLYSFQDNRATEYPQFKRKGIRSFWDVKVLKNGHLLFGTDNGLVEKENDSFIITTQNDGLPDRAVYVIHEDINGDIWLGGDRGLIKKSADSYRLFNSADGLKGTIISQVLEDNNGLWLCTDKGLQFFSNDKPGRLFGMKDGLLGEEFTTQNSSLIDDNGNFWLGLFGGLTIFDPYKRSNTPVNPRLYLTAAEYRSDEDPVSFLGERQPLIDYSQNNVLFKILGLYYYNENSLKYSYQLEGLDNRWFEAHRGETIRYSNLAAGEYNLRIKPVVDGQAVDAVLLAANFIIDKPLWQQTWFVALSVILIIVTVFTITAYSNRKILAMNRDLQHKIDTNIKQLAIAEATIENIIEHSGSIIVSTDLKGRITTWNKRAEEVFGYSKEFILNKSIKILDLDDDLWSFVSVLDEVKKSGELRQLEIKKKTSDGSVVDIIVSSTLLKDRDGRTHLVNFSMEDFSERNKLLEFRINREKMLAGIEALNNLLATLSHHINNSTASISGMAQLAEIDSKYNEKFVEVTNFQVFRIQAVLKSLGGLVDKLNLKTKSYIGDSESLFDIDDEIAGFISSLDKITSLKIK